MTYDRMTWIKCADKLPEIGGLYLVTIKLGTAVFVMTCHYFAGVKQWGSPTGKVIAWMPLPDPYGGEQ